MHISICIGRLQPDSTLSGLSELRFPQVVMVHTGIYPDASCIYMAVLLCLSLSVLLILCLSLCMCVCVFERNRDRDRDKDRDRETERQTERDRQRSS